MFMDEARFGRISELRQCWAPAGTRPVVPKQVVREWIYAYVSTYPNLPEVSEPELSRIGFTDVGVAG